MRGLFHLYITMILKNLKLRLLLKQPQLFNAQTIRYYVEINGNPLNQIAVYLVRVFL